jgi:hypothetical protein
MQADIEGLEKELDELDEWDAESEQPRRLKCLQDRERDVRESHMAKMPPDFCARFDRTRPDMLKELTVKLAEYGMAPVYHAVSAADPSR